MSERHAVVLVDHKNRDLLGASLIAYQLEQRGIVCHLEPLESYYGCLAAYAPDLIVFNHINSSHLVKYSYRLKELGVLTAVLPNEGILYDEEVLRYNSGRFHKGSHMDFYFCWNEVHQKALIEEGPGGQHTRIEVCGVPRFDFYLEPWRRVYSTQPKIAGARPKILVCTNLAMARYHGLADSDAARFFEPFQRISGYKDYRALIDCHVRARPKLLKYLEMLAGSGLYDIVLRPHPREMAEFYEKAMSAWPEEKRGRVTVDNASNITELILNCDLEISCETCTTALESWVVGKPTIELTFDKHPTFFHEHTARLNVLCEDPSSVLEVVAEALANPEQKHLEEGRRTHLAKWCNTPDGRASERVADMLAKAIHAKKPSKRTYTFSERRKAAKLLALRRLDLAYNFDPLLWFKRRLLPKNYATKSFVYQKTIRPSDVVSARQQLAHIAKEFPRD